MSTIRSLAAAMACAWLGGIATANAIELPSGGALVRDGLSADGRTVTVLTPPSGQSCWGIKQYDVQGTSWMPVAELLGGQPGPNGCSPIIAAASGDGRSVAVHATWDGAIQLLERNRNKLAVTGTIRLTEKPGHNFPAPTQNIALSGDGQLVLIGAENRDCSSALPKDACGIAGLWRREADGWHQRLRIRRPEDAGIVQRFGETVAISADGQAFLVGGRGLFDQSGSLYSYVAESDGGYALVQALRPTEQDPEFATDASLSADGRMLAVGAGQAFYLYIRGADDVWQQAAATSTMDERAGMFGAAVALSGDGRIVTVGAPRSICPESVQSRCGLVFRMALTRTANGITVGQPQRIESPVPVPSTDFGWRVASSQDGKIWAAQGRLTHLLGP